MFWPAATYSGHFEQKLGKREQKVDIPGRGWRKGIVLGESHGMEPGCIRLKGVSGREAAGSTEAPGSVSASLKYNCKFNF